MQPGSTSEEPWVAEGERELPSQPGGSRLKQLAEAFQAISACVGDETAIGLATRQAREIVGAHQAIGTLLPIPDSVRFRSIVAVSQEYAENAERVHHPDLRRVATIAARALRPVRITAAMSSISTSAWEICSPSLGKQPPQTWIVVPLLSRRADLLGMLQLLDKIEGDFSADDEAALTQLAQVTAMVLELQECSNSKDRQRQVAQAEASDRRQAVSNTYSLVRIIKKVTGSLEVDAVLDGLIAETMPLVDADRGCAGVRSAAEMACRRCHDPSGTRSVRQDWPTTFGVPGQVLATGRSVLCCASALETSQVCHGCIQEGSCLVCIPILDGERKAIGFFQLHRKKAFTHEDERVLEWAAQAVSPALQNALTHQRVQQAEHELRELSSRLIHLQDEERRRLARELHDTTGQTLAGLIMNLGSLRPWADGLEPKARLLLLDSIALAKECARDIRTMSYLLHPPTLDDFGLRSAISWYVKGFSQRSRIDVKFDIPLVPERLPPEIETTLFRVVQQSLSNVHQHSCSSTAEIAMYIDSQRVVLSVTDHGQGIEENDMLPKEEDGLGVLLLGVGIAGMRERVRQLGGDLTVQSRQGQGTKVTAVLPLLERR